MATYKTPGVYIEDVPQIVLSIAEVETAIPAFIGYTHISNKTGSTINPVRIISMLEYESIFGTADLVDITVTVTDKIDNGLVINRNVTSAVAVPSHTMYYHMQMYFANGGGPCYIVSIGQESDTVNTDDFYAGLAAVALEDEPTLLLFPDGVQLLTQDELYELYDAALQQCTDLKDRFVIMDCHGGTADDEDVPESQHRINIVSDFRNGIGMQNLKYGAAYYPFLKTSLNYRYTDDTVKIKHIYFDNFGQAGDFTAYPISNIPDYLLSNVLIDKNNIYKIGKQAANDFRITLNPSATIAGVYAATDNSRGVWKAPANVSLSSVNGLEYQVSEEEQSGLNVDANAGKSVNAIRAFPGKGIVVWGARTLAGNNGEWRYVPVRRFFNMVEENIKKAVESFVFEANDAGTWVKIKSLVNNYLTTLWKAGALKGTDESQAFYVAAGLGETMTAEDILEGRLFVEIGMAAVRPAEFIVVRFSHTMAEN